MESSAWLKEQIEKYRVEQTLYVAYANTLRAILEAACRLYAPLAIVQVRPKSLSSFAEKALRKAFKYRCPVRQITDLCGGRVITETQGEVDRICQFIREHLVVDEGNSLDTRTRLGTSEFGYLSSHYVVQLRPGEVLGVSIPEEIGGRKAEIQVRTLLQHAWASVSHDRIYKTQFRVPEAWHRRLARVAALLEEADGAFAHVVEGLDAYRLDYGAYMTPQDMRREIETLQTILANEPAPSNRPAIALRLARIAKSAWDWTTIAQQLSPFVDAPGVQRPEILMEHGHALCQLHKRTPSAPEYRQGQRELGEATKTGADATRIQAMRHLAWSYGNVPNQETTAREWYREAYRSDPSDPYTLASYLEYESYCERALALPLHVRPALQSAIEHCRAHAEAGIELPWAFFTMGKFFLLLDQPTDSLAAYCKAIHLCARDRGCCSEEVLDTELEFLRRISFGRPLPAEYRWVEDLLLLAKAVRFQSASALEELGRRAARRKPYAAPVVVVAGGADLRAEPDVQAHRDCLLRAFDGFQGTLLSGGTTAGVPGIIGSLMEQPRGPEAHPPELIAYLPAAVPVDVTVDKRYPERLLTEGAAFSPRQPLQAWIDLVAAGVSPSVVRVLGVNGGPIAEFEYRLALALGATVGILEASGRAACSLASETPWWDTRRLLHLPRDPMTVRAFVQPGATRLAAEQLDGLGKTIHAKFLEENRHKSADPAMLPWELLREDFRESNRMQAAYAEEVLRDEGYSVRPAAPGAPLVTFPKDQVERMAEMEHGRFVVERIRAGWTRGSVRDLERKLSPYLVSWPELPENIKEYDRRAVREWPAIFADAHLEIHAL